MAFSVLLGGASGAVFGFFGNALTRQGLSSLWGQVGSRPRNAPAPPPPATAEEASTVAVIDRVSPAVVSIVIRAKVGTRVLRTPFDEFFGSPFELGPFTQDGPPAERQIGGGSGFIVSSDGYILTNRHVVDEKEATLTVVSSDGKEFGAKVVALDPILDLAVIKISAADLPVVTLGDSDRIRIGESALAIGNALGSFRNTVTKGIISGLNRRIVAGDDRGASEVIEDAIQTDAAINPGNSGGPLVNLHGEVIGIAAAVERPAQGVGFAIPINIAKRAIDDARMLGRITRPRLGVRYVIVDKEVTDKEKLAVDHGALVVGEDGEAVLPNSPAAKAGIKSGDIIFSVDGTAVTDTTTLAKLITRHRPGDAVTLLVMRQDKQLVLNAVLDEFPSK